MLAFWWNVTEEMGGSHHFFVSTALDSFIFLGETLERMFRHWHVGRDASVKLVERRLTQEHHGFDLGSLQHAVEEIQIEKATSVRLEAFIKSPESQEGRLVQRHAIAFRQLREKT